MRNASTSLFMHVCDIIQTKKRFPCSSTCCNERRLKMTLFCKTSIRFAIVATLLGESSGGPYYFPSPSYYFPSPSIVINYTYVPNIAISLGVLLYIEQSFISPSNFLSVAILDKLSVLVKSVLSTIRFPHQANLIDNFLTVRSADVRCARFARSRGRKFFSVCEKT